MPGAEGNEGDETNRLQPKRRAVRIQCPLPQKLFSSQVTFHIPIVCGINLDIGSFLQPVARRDEAWRGVARRAAEEERAWMSLLFSCSYKW